MIKTIAYISTVLFLGLWAWPAQAGCNCQMQYRQQYQTRAYQQQYYYPYRAAQDYDPVFGDWYGVDNTQQVNNPFGDWYGVNNFSQQSNPFGDWYGVNNTGVQNSNPFSDWYGVNNNTTPIYSSAPVYAAPRVDQNAVVQNGQYVMPVQYQNNNSNVPRNTYFVAPKTGVNKYAPFAFAGLLTVGFFAIKKRKWIFN